MLLSLGALHNDTVSALKFAATAGLLLFNPGEKQIFSSKSRPGLRYIAGATALIIVGPTIQHLAYHLLAQPPAELPAIPNRVFVRTKPKPQATRTRPSAKPTQTVSGMGGCTFHALFALLMCFLVTIGTIFTVLGRGSCSSLAGGQTQNTTDAVTEHGSDGESPAPEGALDAPSDSSNNTDSDAGFDTLRQRDGFPPPPPPPSETTSASDEGNKGFDWRILLAGFLATVAFEWLKAYLAKMTDYDETEEFDDESVPNLVVQEIPDSVGFVNDESDLQLSELAAGTNTFEPLDLALEWINSDDSLNSVDLPLSPKDSGNQLIGLSSGTTTFGRLDYLSHHLGKALAAIALVSAFTFVTRRFNEAKAQLAENDQHPATIEIHHTVEIENSPADPLPAETDVATEALVCSNSNSAIVEQEVAEGAIIAVSLEEATVQDTIAQEPSTVQDDAAAITQEPSTVQNVAIVVDAPTEVPQQSEVSHVASPTTTEPTVSTPVLQASTIKEFVPRAVSQIKSFIPRSVPPSPTPSVASTSQPAVILETFPIPVVGEERARHRYRGPRRR